jgi:hypothetical protein
MRNITRTPAPGGGPAPRRGRAWNSTAPAPIRIPAHIPTRTSGSPATSASAGAAAAVAALTRLTDRDRYLLQVLAEHRVLTADQIARLKFTDPNTARKRLVLLTRRGILDRFRDGVRPGSQAWRYTLGPLGAAIVAAEHAWPAPRPAAHAQQVLRLARSPRLAHLLGVNEFFVALAAHARRNPGYALRWWLNEARATAACAALAHPDGLGVWTHHDPRGVVREAAFFVEHDEGTEPIPRLLAKLAGYAEARLGGGPAHPVLFWLPTAAREAHLHAAIRDQPSSVPVATATRQHADAEGTGPAGPVWLTPGQATRRRLIDLGLRVAPVATAAAAGALVGQAPVAAAFADDDTPVSRWTSAATPITALPSGGGSLGPSGASAWPPVARDVGDPGDEQPDGHARPRASWWTGERAANDRPDREGDLPHVA